MVPRKKQCKLMTTDQETTPIRAAQYMRMSPEHQQHSTYNKTEKIAEYDQRRDIQIVRTYADEAKRGLSLNLANSLRAIILGAASGQTPLISSCFDLHGTFQRPARLL